MRPRRISLVDRLRSSLVWRFHERLRLATQRMPCRLRVVSRARVLVIAPHMDDEVIPCGGTLILHRRAGSPVAVVFASDSAGDSADGETRRSMSELRQREAEAVAAQLGLELLEFLGFPDTAVSAHERDVAAGLRRAVDRWRPDQVWCPFPSDAHGDHQAVARALARALDADWPGQVWAYELWSTIWPNTAVDITTAVDEKRRAIGLYASQVADRDYAAGILGLNRYRGLPFRLESVEAFYVCGATEFRRLALPRGL